MLQWLEGVPVGFLYLIQFAALFVEGTGLPGILVEPFFLATSLLISQYKASFVVAWLLAALGNFLGNLVGYAIGRRWLDPFLQRIGPRLGLTPERLETVQDWFRRYGPWAVFIGRWFGPIRTPALLLAGAARIPLGAFAIASALAALTWTGVYQAAFWLLGQATVDLLRRQTGGLFLVLLLLVALAGLLWWRSHRLRPAPSPGLPQEGERGILQVAEDLFRREDGPRTRRRRLRWFSILLLALALSSIPSLAYMAWQFQLNSRVPVPSAPFPEVDASWRLLVLAPHPDDEVLGAGGLMQKVLGAGGSVHVVVVTAGDSFARAAFYLAGKVPGRQGYLALGARRIQESLEAVQYLGLTPQQITFLGFPDKGLEPIWLHYWDPAKAYRNPFTGYDRVPYDIPAKGTPYNGPALAKALEAVLLEYRPTAIVAPYPLDEHPDHRATYDFLLWTLADLGWDHIPIYTYVVHHGEWPSRWQADPDNPLGPPRELARIGPWVSLPLTLSEGERKLHAIRLYTSQMRVMGSWLQAFARANEIFSPMMPVDASGPAETRSFTLLGQWAWPKNRLAKALLPVLPPSLKTRVDWSAMLEEVSTGAEDQGWLIRLRTRGRPDPNREYRLRWWVFPKDLPPQGYQVIIHRNQVSVREVTPSTRPWPKDLPVQARWTPSGLALFIPEKALQSPRLLIAVDIGRPGGIEDRSAWVLILDRR
ncbi:MAG: PIG-L family deacetylase [Clostridiales bacterium]|nr:PIG-L family deacetylase [Clostridiales bacterium]